MQISRRCARNCPTGQRLKVICIGPGCDSDAPYEKAQQFLDCGALILESVKNQKLADNSHWHSLWLNI